MLIKGNFANLNGSRARTVVKFKLARKLSEKGQVMLADFLRPKVEGLTAMNIQDIISDEISSLGLKDDDCRLADSIFQLINQ
jgi:hypothetical protein